MMKPDNPCRRVRHIMHGRQILLKGEAGVRELVGDFRYLKDEC